MEYPRNYSEKFKEAALKLAKNLKNKFGEDIIGISIYGSLAYGSADEFSDIDLDIWLPEETYKKWIIECPLIDYLKEYSPNRETPTNLSFCVGDSYKFDLTLLSIEGMVKEPWRVEQKSDRKDSIILFDKEDTIRKILDKMLKIEEEKFYTKEKYSVLNPNPEYYIFYISAYLNYHVPVAIARKKFEQAHFLINQSILFLLNLLWLKKEKFYPYDKSKWIIVNKYLNEDEKNLLRDSMVVKDHSKEDIQRRRKVLRELFSKLGYKETKFYHEKLDLS